MSKQSEKYEKCPWYETFFRICFFLGLTLFIYCGLLLNIGLAIMTADKLFPGAIIEQTKSFINYHPTGSLIGAIIGYGATTCWVMYKTVEVIVKNER